jgi:hypothetical protein
MRDFLTREDLQGLSRKLALLSPHRVRDFYLKAWDACRLGPQVPKPRAIQELVTAWKQLRKLRADTNRAMAGRDRAIR